MASGCLMVSAPTGFVIDLMPSQVACWTLPLTESSQSWASTICQILSENDGPDANQHECRGTYLNPARFSALAIQIVEICWPND